MAQAINGIGTALYGQRDFRSDRSYVTTEWFIFCFIPIFPLRSLRVIRNLSADENLVVYTSENFHIVDTMRPNLHQVLSTYAFALFCALWFAFVFWLLFVRFTLDWQRYGAFLVFGAVFFAAIPFFAPLLLRKYSKPPVSSSSPQMSVPPPLPQRREATTPEMPQ